MINNENTQVLTEILKGDFDYYRSLSPELQQDLIKPEILTEYQNMTKKDDQRELSVNIRGTIEGFRYLASNGENPYVSIHIAEQFPIKNLLGIDIGRNILRSYTGGCPFDNMKTMAENLISNEKTGKYQEKMETFKGLKKFTTTTPYFK